MAGKFELSAFAAHTHAFLLAAGRHLRQTPSKNNVCGASAVATATARGGGKASSQAQAQAICNALDTGSGGIPSSKELVVYVCASLSVCTCRSAVSRQHQSPSAAEGYQVPLPEVWVQVLAACAGCLFVSWLLFLGCSFISKHIDLKTYPACTPCTLLTPSASAPPCRHCSSCSQCGCNWQRRDSRQSHSTSRLRR